MAGLDLKQLHAHLNLAWRVIIHYLRKLNPLHDRYGVERFRTNYVPEGLPPALPAYRELAHEPGRCTSCGECDLVCPMLDGRLAVPGPLDATTFTGPMSIVTSGARAAPHLEDARADLEVLISDSCANCRACDRACPERIPIAALSHALLNQLAIIDAARQGRAAGSP